MRVVGIDLSLTGAGVATIDAHPSVDGGTIGTNVVLRRFTTRPAGQALDARGVRLRGLATDLIALCHHANLVVIEAPTYGYANAPSGSLHDRAGAWWLTIATLTARGTPCVEVSPTTLKCYALGKGSGKGVTKDAVFAATVRRYQHHVLVNSNDEADALVLAAMGARNLGSPIDNLPQQHTRAMSAVDWPPPRREATA